MIRVKDLNFVNNDTIMLVKFGGYEAKYTITPAKVTALKTWLGSEGKQHVPFYEYLKDQGITEVINKPDDLGEDKEGASSYFVTITDADGIDRIVAREDVPDTEE